MSAFFMLFEKNAWILFDNGFLAKKKMKSLTF